MNSRERVVAALSHRLPDRPPRDLGGTTATGIHPFAYASLCQHLGLAGGKRLVSARGQLSAVEPSVIERLGLDFLPLIPRSAGEPLPLDANRAYVDRWGIERRLPHEGGHYYVSRSPLARVERSSELDAFRWPEPITDYSELAQHAKTLREDTDKALVLNPEVGFLHQTQFLRGFDQWLMDLVSDPRLAGSLMDRALELWLVETGAMLDQVGPFADVVLYADDLAFQNQTMFSPNVFRSLIRPRLQKAFDRLKSSGLILLHHTCGNIWPFIDDLVEMGIDALNPIQVSAGDMGRTAELKRRWGGSVSFWGGIDTQHVLPAGTPDDVRAEVWHRLDDLAQDGGFVLAAVHDLQAEVSPSNICAMFDAATEWSATAGKCHG